MWIRSQDKTVLEEVKSIAIRVVIDGETKETKSVKGWSIITLNPNTYSELGIYYTEERTIDILDEIQIHINAVNQVKYGAVLCTVNDKLIFEMPEK